MNLIKDEPLALGRSRVFKVTPDIKEEQKLGVINKRIQKKMKKIEALEKTTKKSLKERELILSKKVELEASIQVKKGRIEEEVKMKTSEEVVQEVQEM